MLPALMAFSSCSNDKLDEDGSQSGAKSKLMPRITLNITPISIGSTNANVTEMIKSLRIIMLNEVTLSDGSTQSYVEFNRFLDFYGEFDDGMFSGPGEVANTFRYIITRNSVPGVKKFYLVANETEVSAVNFQMGVNDNLPAGLSQGMPLHDFFETYGIDYIEDLNYPLDETPEKGTPKGKEFEKWVNCIYYTPQFTQTQQTMGDGTTRNVIFLPYSSQYTYTLATQADIDAGKVNGAVNILDGVMYLVPAATKFQFKFRNYRDKDVEIPSLKLSGIASDMYLFAQVDPGEQTKTYMSKSYWWVDWLALVAAESQKPDYEDPTSNGGFNNRVGWISNFTLPESAYPQSTQDEFEGEPRPGTMELVDDTYITVPGRVSGDPISGVPGITLTGYYYLPESRNMVKQDITNENGEITGTIDVQRYFLTLTMGETLENSQKVTKDTPIGNLGSMFRDTNTLITVTMRDSKDVGAYAEIAKWNVTHTSGNVIEDNTPQ